MSRTPLLSSGSAGFWDTDIVSVGGSLPRACGSGAHAAAADRDAGGRTCFAGNRILARAARLDKVLDAIEVAMPAYKAGNSKLRGPPAQLPSR